MAYTAPYIDETGLHYSSFAEIKQYYTDGAKQIFGDDIYLDDDSMDGQLISIISKANYDTCKAIEFAYNNTTPQTAYGTVLSRLVLLSGIERKVAGYSTAFCKLTGSPFTIIHSGVVADLSGNKWNLPNNVNLGENGITTVTVTAQKQGTIQAGPNTITQIVTPTFGWKTVTNEQSANPATPVEEDYELRYRQRNAIALPSKGLVEGTQSALLNLEGVTDCIVKENEENVEITVEGEKLPPHSITCVVKGGSEKEIANTIFYRKNQGCYTNGDIEITQYDKFNNVNYIRFFRPTQIPIEISVKIKPFTGYSSDITDQIKNDLISYIDSLNISKDVTLSALYSIINESIPDLKEPIFSVTELKIAKLNGVLGTDDIVINLKEEAYIEATDVTIEIVKD